MSDIDYDKLQSFADGATPPRRESAPKRLLPAINNGTLILGGGLIGLALIFMLVTRIVGGESFAGDILVLGSMGVLACGIVFCLSALGAYLYNQMKTRSATAQPGWVAAIVVDRQFDAASEAGSDFIFMDLVDGRRVRLQPVDGAARGAKAGDVGWISYKGDALLDFVPESAI